MYHGEASADVGRQWCHWQHLRCTVGPDEANGGTVLRTTGAHVIGASVVVDAAELHPERAIEREGQGINAWAGGEEIRGKGASRTVGEEVDETATPIDAAPPSAVPNPESAATVGATR